MSRPDFSKRGIVRLQYGGEIEAGLITRVGQKRAHDPLKFLPCGDVRVMAAIEGDKSPIGHALDKSTRVFDRIERVVCAVDQQQGRADLVGERKAQVAARIDDGAHGLNPA